MRSRRENSGEEQKVRDENGFALVKQPSSNSKK